DVRVAEGNWRGSGRGSGNDGRPLLAGRERGGEEKGCGKRTARPGQRGGQAEESSQAPGAVGAEQQRHSRFTGKTCRERPPARTPGAVPVPRSEPVFQSIPITVDLLRERSIPTGRARGKPNLPRAEGGGGRSGPPAPAPRPGAGSTPGGSC